MEEKQFSARVAEYKAMVEGYLSSCLQRRSAQVIIS